MSRDTLSELFRRRDAGWLRIGTVSTYPAEDVAVPLARLGITYSGERCRELNATEAAALLANLFVQDLAYGSKLMEYSEAQRFAAYVLSEVFPADAKLWTNIDDFSLDPHEFRNGYAGYFSGASSTFSVGVVARTDSTLAVVWVEDED